MKKFFTEAFIIVVIFGLLASYGLIASIAKPTNNTPPSTNDSQLATVPAATAPQPTTITYQGQDNKTALQLLKEQADVATKTSSFGEYVDKINNLPDVNQTGKYWLFFVNGAPATVGADQYQTKNGEVIEWRLE